MKLFEIFGDLIKDDLRRNRGRKTRELVKAASQKANASTERNPIVGTGYYAMEVPKDGAALAAIDSGGGE